MNNIRRKEIKKIKNKIQNYIEEIKNDIENVLADEEFAFDSMPENLQDSMRGMDSQDAIDVMNNAINALEESYDELDSII